MIDNFCMVKEQKGKKEDMKILHSEELEITIENDLKNTSLRREKRRSPLRDRALAKRKLTRLFTTIGKKLSKKQIEKKEESSSFGTDSSFENTLH